MKIHNQCPMCGSRSWQRINVYHSGYFVGKGLIASIFWGGNGVDNWICRKEKTDISLLRLSLYYGLSKMIKKHGKRRGIIILANDAERM